MVGNRQFEFETPVVESADGNFSFMTKEVNAKIWSTYQIYSVLIVLFQYTPVSGNMLYWLHSEKKVISGGDSPLVVAVKGRSFGSVFLMSLLKPLDLYPTFYLCNPWIH